MLRPNARLQVRGFTLIEILIVVLILGILSAIIIPQFAVSADSARENAADHSVRVVRTQVELYKFNNSGDVPSFTDLEDGYLVNFTQPVGYCISIEQDGTVSKALGSCGG